MKHLKRYPSVFTLVLGFNGSIFAQTHEIKDSIQQIKMSSNLDTINTTQNSEKIYYAETNGVMAIPYYQEMLNKVKSLAKTNPQSYEPDIAILQNRWLIFIRLKKIL